MSQRDSGYKRIEHDSYETPEWVTLALLPHLPRPIQSVWEPACASGKMVNALSFNDLAVFGSDITGNPPTDFLKCGGCSYDAIITNPPYALAERFICHSLLLMKPVQGIVAMLLRTDFDHAKTRKYIFQDQTFAKKLVLTKRIKWFEDSKGSPSFNHAWFIWSWQHKGPPTLAYGP